MNKNVSYCDKNLRGKPFEAFQIVASPARHRKNNPVISNN
jgi:hypothetical protein